MTPTKYPHEYINVPFLIFFVSLIILVASVILPEAWLNTQTLYPNAVCGTHNSWGIDEFTFAPWYIQILNWGWIKIICLVVLAISVLYQMLKMINVEITTTDEEKTCENCSNYVRKKE